MLRVTLYHALWFATRYMRMAEQKLASDYKRALEIMLPTLRMGNKRAARKLPEEPPSTPYGLFMTLTTAATLIQQQQQQQQEEKKGTTGDELLAKSAEGEKVAEETDIKMSEAMLELSDVSADFSVVLSWKNRDYTKHLLRLIDLAATVWVLLVCPLWLVFSLVQFLLIYYFIRSNLSEIRLTHRLLKLMGYQQQTKDSGPAISLFFG